MEPTERIAKVSEGLYGMEAGEAMDLLMGAARAIVDGAPDRSWALFLTACMATNVAETQGAYKFSQAEIVAGVDAIFSARAEACLDVPTKH